MKGTYKFLEIIFGIINVVEDLIEALAFPAILVLIGLFNDLPWQYYVISISVYFIIAIIIQLVFHFVFKHFEKGFLHSFLDLFDKIFDKRSDDSQ
ncbi:MAG: hypothetical protein E7614_04730 [Ruminococcaceae bacterium]|nr:hypothetical protein [Oscillospiraceae bacterium]